MFGSLFVLVDITVLLLCLSLFLIVPTANISLVGVRIGGFCERCIELYLGDR